MPSNTLKTTKFKCNYFPKTILEEDPPRSLVCLKVFHTPQLQLSPDIKQLFLSTSNYYFHVKKQFILRTIYSQILMILWAEANELQQVLM